MKVQRKTYVIIFLLIFIAIWIYTGVVVMTDWKPFGRESNGYNIFSYVSTSKQYSSSIKGLQYINILNNVINIGEPPLFTLGELLYEWHPDNTSPESWVTSKAHPNTGKGLVRLDYLNPQHRLTAQEFRDAELPFILLNVPEIASAADVFSIPELLKNFGSMPRMVEKSPNNHFMYFHTKNDARMSKLYPDWEPPQIEVPMTFAKFLREAEAAETFSSENGATRPLHYMTMSASEGKKTMWVRDAFPFFSPEESFFIVNPDGYRGINCRFGMRGVVAEAHYDGQRNFVSMVRGRKRYILLPPRACPRLSLLPRGHPSGRHASFDWSDMNKLRDHPELMAAEATEVVLSMGEMLYIPSYWFHYIISQDASIQCNARSGNSEIGYADIVKCGFYENTHSIRSSSRNGSTSTFQGIESAHKVVTSGFEELPEIVWNDDQSKRLKLDSVEHKAMSPLTARSEPVDAGESDRHDQATRQGSSSSSLYSALRGKTRKRKDSSKFTDRWTTAV